jgi:hypothetical protein
MEAGRQRSVLSMPRRIDLKRIRTNLVQDEGLDVDRLDVDHVPHVAPNDAGNSSATTQMNAFWLLLKRAAENGRTNQCAETAQLTA